MSNQLLPFQKISLEWLRTRSKAFLALEQGLGKTVIASVDLVVPAVIICPASLKYNWQSELSKWRPELKAQVIRKASDKVDLTADVHIVNYDILHKLSLPQPTTLIADESHYAKNPKANRTKALVKLIKQTERVRLLSGTPVVNRPIELWPLMYAIGATKLGYFEFGMRFCSGWKTPWDTYDFSGSSRQGELQKILSECMLRLTKEQVLPELPEKTWRVIELDLPVDKREKELDLDQILRNPESVPFEAISDILKMNAQRKLPLAIAHIEDALESEHKIIIFARHTEIIGELMQSLAKYKPVKITGSDSADQRNQSVKTFQNNHECRVFIGNIQAAGVGLTLTAASRVIFVESSWSPADMAQCADRCHRIGQKNAVIAEILTIHQSIDSTVLHSVMKKMDVIKKIVQETDLSVVQFASHKLFKENSMNAALIAQKLREIADLLVEQTVVVEEQPKAKAVKEDLKPVIPPVVEVAKEDPTITIDQVRDVMARMLDNGWRTQAMEILKANGAEKLRDLEDDKFAAVHAACLEALS